MPRIHVGSEAAGRGLPRQAALMAPCSPSKWWASSWIWRLGLRSSRCSPATVPTRTSLIRYCSSGRGSEPSSVLPGVPRDTQQASQKAMWKPGLLQWPETSDALRAMGGRKAGRWIDSPCSLTSSAALAATVRWTARSTMRCVCPKPAPDLRFPSL